MSDEVNFFLILNKIIKLNFNNSNFRVKSRSFASDCSENVGCNEEHVDSDDDVGDELVGQLGNEFVPIWNVVFLTLKLFHVLAQQAAHDEVGEGLENCSESLNNKTIKINVQGKLIENWLIKEIWSK